MITAILCAAGRGERAGFAQNKVLQELNGMCVLSYSLSAFAQCDEVGEILVVCRKEDEAQIKELIRPYPSARTVLGGDTRTQSVYFALKQTKGEIVLVHDAARPFVTKKMIDDCITSIKTHDSGVCALNATDTTVLVSNGAITAALPRGEVFTVQTPQGFYTDKLLSAYESAFAENRESDFTDESGIYARYVAPPYLFLGDRGNKKLTYPEDFAPAARVGFGVDTHAFIPRENAAPFCGDPEKAFPDDGVPLVNFITLGDVLVHALMDALLSAAGLRDIGFYFPDTDERFAGADSMELLQEVMRLIGEQGFTPANVSISVLAETPRLSPYIERMKETLASVLNLPPTAIGIAAGTNEKLGYVGEGKGITCYATVLLK